MATATSGMKDVLSKVRVPKRTKQAVAMNKAFEPTATAIMYWDDVRNALDARKEKYQAAIDAFQAKGGSAEALDDDLKVSLSGVDVIYRCTSSGGVVALDMHIPLNEGVMDVLDAIVEAQEATWGASKNDRAMELIDELQAWVETDGVLKGQHNLANNAILSNPLLTAASMVPDEAKAKKPKE